MNIIKKQIIRGCLVSSLCLGVAAPSFALNVEMTPIPNNLSAPANPVAPVVSKVPVAPLVENPQSNSQGITVTAQTFTLALPANPTTGYGWFIKDYDTNLVSIVGHHYVNQNPKMIGAGGKEMWTFHLSDVAFRAPHLITITMRYARPFDVNDGSDKVITLMTRVR